MDRYAEFTEIIGAPGRGKTTLLLNILKQRINSGDRALVILPDDSESAWYPYPVIYADELEEKFNPDFKGILCVEYEEKITFPFLYKKLKEKTLKNFILVLDDPFYAEGRPEDEIRKILARKRQYAIDIFSNAHSYDQVPPLFFKYITIYGLMHTSGGIANRKEHLAPHYETHVAIKNRVDTISNVPKGQPNYYYIEFFRLDGSNI